MAKKKVEEMVEEVEKETRILYKLIAIDSMVEYYGFLVEETDHQVVLEKPIVFQPRWSADYRTMMEEIITGKRAYDMELPDFAPIPLAPTIPFKDDNNKQSIGYFPKAAFVIVPIHEFIETTEEEMRLNFYQYIDNIYNIASLATASPGVDLGDVTKG